MLDIDREEREQQEADERVDALKKRLEAIRASKARTNGVNDMKVDNSAQGAETGIALKPNEQRSRRNRRVKEL